MNSILQRVELDYKNVEPRCHRYYIPFLYQKKMPEVGSIDYYRFLELLKFLETLKQFDPSELSCFVNEVNQ